MREVIIYTDGACRGNPGRGGWAAVLIYQDKIKEIYGSEVDTTNNRMELTAVIKGLSALKEPCKVTLYSDSTYVVNSIQKGWLYSWKSKGWKRADNKPVLNIDLWQELLLLLEEHDVEFIWVRGHSSNEYNERCDSLATSAADSI